MCVCIWCLYMSIFIVFLCALFQCVGVSVFTCNCKCVLAYACVYAREHGQNCKKLCVSMSHKSRVSVGVLPLLSARITTHIISRSSSALPLSFLLLFVSLPWIPARSSKTRMSLCKRRLFNCTQTNRSCCHYIYFLAWPQSHKLASLLKPRFYCSSSCLRLQRGYS